MTEQELRSKFQSDCDTGYTDENESGKLEYLNCMSENAAIAFAKAYADTETKELEEAYAELKSSYEKFYESDAVQHKQILALNAEIKRLRDSREDARKQRNDYQRQLIEARSEVNRLSAKAESLQMIVDAFGVYPAPVTEGMDSGYCPLCIGTGKEIGVYEVGVCSCRTPLSPKNEDQE